MTNMTAPGHDDLYIITTRSRCTTGRFGWHAGSPGFRELLSRAKTVVRGALDNADLPFMLVVQAAGVPRSTAYSPLFQVMCVLQDASFDQEARLDGLEQQTIEVLTRPSPLVSRGLLEDTKHVSCT